METNITLGNIIRTKRKKLGMTMKELGSRVNVSEQAISQYELDKRFPDDLTLIKIGVQLHSSACELLSEAGKSEDDIINFYDNICDVVVNTNYKLCLSKRLIDYLETPIMLEFGSVDTLKVIEDKLNIDYESLKNCVQDDKELQIDDQIKLIDLLNSLDRVLFSKFAIRYYEKIISNIELSEHISYLLGTNMCAGKHSSIDKLKGYILNEFTPETSKLLTEEVMHDLKKEVTKFLEFKLYEIAKMEEDK